MLDCISFPAWLQWLLWEVNNPLGKTNCCKCITWLLPCLFSLPKQVYSNSHTNLYSPEFLSAIALPSRQSPHFLFAPSLFYLYVGLDFWFVFLRYLFLELVPAFLLMDGMFYKVFSVSTRQWEKRMWCLPFSDLREQRMSESKIKKVTLKQSGSWWCCLLVSTSNLSQSTCRAEDCNSSLMSMAETCAIIHHHNKA